MKNQHPADGKMKTQRIETDQAATPSADGGIIVPLATAAMLDPSTFACLNPTDTIPATWEERARKAWEYYAEEPIVKNAVNSWRTFAVGDEIRIAADDEAVRDKAKGFSDRLGISDFVKDMILQLLVKGDAIGFKRYTKDLTDIEEITCVNPVSVKVKYTQGRLIEVRQYQEDKANAGDGLMLPVEQTLHLKWDAPEFSPRGNSLVLPAFQSIELLRDYRRAEQAIAKRWTTPFRLIKVGGAFGQKMVMPDQKMLDQVRDMVNNMDMRSGLVVPFFVTAETHGTEGHVLNVEEKVKEVKEDIMVALGLSRSLVSGDGPNFATASVSLQKMFIMIREIKHAARRILDWIYNDWMELRNNTGGKLHYIFNDLDPSDATDFKKLLIELYDRKLISKSTMLMKMDLDPGIETANQLTERGTVDLTDEKQVKPIVDMVVSGLMSIPTAQKMLGLDPKENAPKSAWGGLYGQDDMSEHICDECAYFKEDNNRCGLTDCEVTFTSVACRYCQLKVYYQHSIQKGE